MSSNDDKNFSGLMKMQIFDGKDKSKYQEWADDLYATLQYYDLEEYVEAEWKDKTMPAKTVTDAKDVLIRREMKKAMAMFIRATKELPNMIVKECETPYEIHEKLKAKYSVRKVRDDFDTLDTEWNEFKVTDIGTDPDLVYKTLEEQSRKLAVFGDRYSKDALQMLSKLKCALPKEYDHVFTYLNTNEERGKNFEEQLLTAKAMISSHYKTKVESGDNLESSMICMMASEGGSKRENFHCTHCGKKGHTAYKDGKPFCYGLKNKLNVQQGKSSESVTTSNDTSDFRGKCFKCGERGHIKKNCPKKKNNTGQDLNTLFITCAFIGDSDSDSDNSDCDDMPLLENYDEDNDDLEYDDIFGNKEEFVNCSFTEDINTVALYEGKNFEWLGDTGAQCHVLSACEDDEGSSEHSVKMGDASRKDVLRKENILIVDELGVPMNLYDTRIVKGMATNIVSILQLVAEGWLVNITMIGDKKIIEVKYQNKKLVFWEKDKKNLAFLTAKVVESDMVVNVTTDISCDYNEFHDKMGHFGEERLRALAKSKGVKLIGVVKSCNACNAVSAKARPIPRMTKTVVSVVGERMGLDTSGPFPLTSGRNHKPVQEKLYWFGLSDHYSRKMLMNFGNKKSQLEFFVRQAYEFMKTRGTPIQIIRMDNAGENKVVETMCKQEFNIKVEFTPPDTPKLNGIVERGFAIRWEKAKILMQNAGLKDNVKRNKKILKKAITMASYLTEECAQKKSLLSSNELFYGSDAKIKVKYGHYVEWGRVGFVTNKRSHTKKMDCKGKPMMMVGYALDHPSGTYNFYNPATNNIVLSNSVKWNDFSRWEVSGADGDVGKLKEEKVDVKDSDSGTEEEFFDEKVEEKVVPFSQDDQCSVNPDDGEQCSIDGDVGGNDMGTRVSKSNSGSINIQVSKDKVAKVQRALKKLGTSPSYTVTGNVVPYNIFENKPDSDEDGINVILTEEIMFSFRSVGGILDYDDEDNLNEQLVMHTCIQSDPGEPTRWQDALNGPEREWWLKATIAEFNNFLIRGAWKFVPRHEVKSRGRKVIPTKLVFKKKDEIDGSIRFKARDVTLGFMMIPGVDFTERFSPVATDASLRIQIAINLKFYSKGWRTRSLDVEAAFLEPEMDNEMYIEPHPAMVVCGFMTEEERKRSAILLLKSMYGNVDAAIKFFKELVKHITDKKDMNMKQSLADPCVFYRLDETEKLDLLVTVTVDDCAITGLEEHIEWFMDNVEKRFKITRGGILSKHLGVIYEWGKLENGKMFCKATMDKKVDGIVKSYEEYIKGKVKEYETPGKPHEYLDKHIGDPLDLDEYRSLVGKIMFFTTKLSLKTGSATRALSGHMMNPGLDHWKAMGRAVGYLSQMKLKGIMYVEPESFRVVALADTDFGNCKETRRSVGCTLVTVGGCIADYSTAKHKTVSDSTTEAEYKEMTKCAKSVKFVQMLLGEFRLSVLPGLIGEDNAGAIFLARNKQVSERTKHIDLKHHFIREFIDKRDEVQQGEIFKIQSEYNTADVGTNNVEVQLFKRHEEELDNGMPDLREKIFGKEGVLAKMFSGGMLEAML